jgi:chromosome segregation ATPase
MTGIKAIIAAGAVTGVVLVAIVALNVDRLSAGGEVSSPAESEPPADVLSDPEIQILLQEQQELEATVSQMQAREAEYAQQIEAAQQTIEELETTIGELQAEAEADSVAIAQYESQIDATNAVVSDLEATAGALREREAAYAAQIENLNQTILALQAQVQQIAGQ